MRKFGGAAAATAAHSADAKSEIAGALSRQTALRSKVSEVIGSERVVIKPGI
jgi:hypothetical protein